MGGFSAFMLQDGALLRFFIILLFLVNCSMEVLWHNINALFLSHPVFLLYFIFILILVFIPNIVSATGAHSGGNIEVITLRPVSWPGPSLVKLTWCEEQRPIRCKTKSAEERLHAVVVKHPVTSCLWHKV